VTGGGETGLASGLSALGQAGGALPGRGSRARGVRAAAIACAAAAAVLAVHLWARTPHPAGVFYDDGAYVVLARALAEGHGYRALNLPGAPPGVHYPPGYPALLSLVWRATGDVAAAVPWMKALNAALMAVAAALLALYASARLALPPAVAAAAAALPLLTVPALAVSTVLFSEPLFLVLMLSALLVADAPRLTPAGAAAAGLLAGAATLARGLGLAVLVGVAYAAWRRGRREGALASVAAAALVLPWGAWVATRAPAVPPLLRGHYGNYVGEWLAAAGPTPAAHLPALLRENVLEWLRFWGTVLAPGLPLLLRTAVAVAALWAAARGAWAARAQHPALAPTLAAYAAVTLLWPFTPDRYLVLLVPWVAALGAAGLADPLRALARALPDERARRRSRLVLLVLGAALLANVVRFQALGYRARGWEVPQRRAAEALEPIVAWVRANLSPEEVVATDGEPLVYLYSGRRAVPNHVRRARPPGAPPDAEVGSTADLAALLAATDARALAVSAPAGPVARLVERLAYERPDLLRLVHLTPAGGRIFRVEVAHLAGSR
jgi:hypothetical protein